MRLLKSGQLSFYRSKDDTNGREREGAREREREREEKGDSWSPFPTTKLNENRDVSKRRKPPTGDAIGTWPSRRRTAQ